MDFRRQLLISAAVLLATNLATAVDNFKFPSQFNHHFDDMADEDGLDQYVDMNDDAQTLTDGAVMHNDKRAPSFSVNGGLRSLTDMLYSRDRANLASGRSRTRNRLLKLGKRDWNNIGVLSTGTGTSDSSDDLDLAPLDKRRSLSVSGPLSALANMLAAEGRRRQFAESRHNRMRLLELGKRSSGDLVAPSGSKFSDISEDSADIFD